MTSSKFKTPPFQPQGHISQRLFVIPCDAALYSSWMFSNCLGLQCVHAGGLCASPFILGLGPSMLGIGFLLLALTVLILGTPWIARGSFIIVGSSFAGVRVTICR